MTTIVYCGQNFMYASVWCEHVSMCVSIYIYVCIIINACDKISSTETLSKQLYMAYCYTTINKTNKKYSQWWVVERDQFC